MDLDEFSRQLESMQEQIHAGSVRPMGLRAGLPGHVGGDDGGARGVGGGDAGRRGGDAAAEPRAGGVAAGGRGGAAAVSGPVRLRARRLPGDGPATARSGRPIGPPGSCWGSRRPTWRASRWPTSWRWRAGWRSAGASLACMRVGRRERWLVRIQPRRGSAFDASITAAVVRDWDGSPTALRWMIREVGPAASASGSDPRPAGPGHDRAVGRRNALRRGERAIGPAPRRGRGRGPARAAAEHRPDRLGVRRADRPVLVHQPPGRAGAGLSGRELDRRAGVLARDRPRRRPAAGRVAPGPLHRARAGRRAGVSRRRRRRPGRLVPRVARPSSPTPRAGRGCSAAASGRSPAARRSSGSSTPTAASWPRTSPTSGTCTCSAATCWRRSSWRRCSRRSSRR